jgi:5'-3' exoribonuclease 1
MMVMPPASKGLLPEPLRRLMVDPDSPILDFYPSNFSVDGEGKRADWESVVLLPFIDFDRLVSAYESAEQLMPADVLTRNNTGKLYLFQYQQGSTETAFCQSTLPTLLPSVTAAHSTVTEMEPKKPLQANVPCFQPVITEVCPAPSL